MDTWLWFHIYRPTFRFRLSTTSLKRLVCIPFQCFISGVYVRMRVCIRVYMFICVYDYKCIYAKIRKITTAHWESFYIDQHECGSAYGNLPGNFKLEPSLLLDPKYASLSPYLWKYKCKILFLNSLINTNQLFVLSDPPPLLKRKKTKGTNTSRKWTQEIRAIFFQ